jgi:hypothetical protein
VIALHELKTANYRFELYEDGSLIVTTPKRTRMVIEPEAVKELAQWLSLHRA